MRKAWGGIEMRLPRPLVTLVRFAGVGAATTFLDLVLFAGLVSAGSRPGVANLLSYSCGIAASYRLNRRWTFGSIGSSGRAAKFVVANLAGLAISTFLLAVLSAVVPSLVAKLATVPVVFLWNFAAARFWVFPAVEALPPKG